MVKEILKGRAIFAKTAEKATLDDLPIATDLLDTLKAHKEDCAGMAANMIGSNKAIIAFQNDERFVVMLNPQIINKEEEYDAREQCLSLSGIRMVKRYKTISVLYTDLKGLERARTYRDFTAEVIQHEIDHLQGRVI